MVEQRQTRRALHLEYEFDRLFASKLELAYDILVPDRVRIVGSAKVTGAGDEERSDLRSCVFGQTAGGEHDRQSYQTAALVTFAHEQKFDVPQEWVFEDDGYRGR